MSDDNEFSTAARVGITIPDSELRNARQQIEAEIGSTEIGMTDGGTMSAQTGGGGGGRAQRRARREHRWSRDNHANLEDILEILENTDFEAGDGGGGLFGDILGGVGGLGGGLAGGIGSGIGSAVGTAVGNAIGDEELTVDAEQFDDVGVTEPEWLPIEVDHPEDPYELDHPEDPYDVDHPEDPYALDHPGEPYAVEDPDTPFAVEDPSPLEVEDVPPLEIEDPPTITVTTETRQRDTSPQTDVPDTLSDPDAVDVGDGGSDGPPGVWDTTLQMSEQWGDEIPGIGHAAGAFYGSARGTAQNLPGVSAPEQDGRSAAGETATPQSRSTRPRATGGGPAVEQINVTQTFDTEVIVDDIRDVADAVSDLERELDGAFADLEDELSDLEGRVDRLERAF
ncbi:hypothetical protein GCM10009646_78870 [Streptomyces aureus]